MQFEHKSVLLQKVIKNLKPISGTVIDATLGGGGHSEEILKNSRAFLVGIDQDGEALSLAKKRLARFKKRTIFIQDNFSNLNEISRKLDLVGKVSVVLMDLGVSSFQFDQPARGFSIKKSGPLDMRMDHRSSLTAYEIVNSWPEKDIADLIYQYGEERLSRKIAKKIVEERRKDKIKTTDQLAGIVKEVLGNRGFGRIHPATKTFQALRIKVNNELGNLEKVLSYLPKIMAENGKIAVISFHSLEDRIVKRCFRDMKKNNLGEIITKKPIVPQKEEVEKNPRARSAKLRIFKIKTKTNKE